jgi:hypothetical protein
MNGAVSGPKIVQDVSDTIPRLARPPAGAFVALELSETDFETDDTLRATIRVTNGASARAIDFYLGYLWPDGVSVTFRTSLSPFASVTVKTNEPGRFQPLVRNAAIQQGLDVIFRDIALLTFPSNFPEGDLLLFAAMTATGTLDIVGNLATAEFTFEP